MVGSDIGCKYNNAGATMQRSAFRLRTAGPARDAAHRNRANQSGRRYLAGVSGGRMGPAVAKRGWEHTNARQQGAPDRSKTPFAFGNANERALRQSIGPNKTETDT